MRLVRGLYFVHATRPDGSPLLTQPTEYDQAAVEAPQLGDAGVAVRAILRRLPGSRARWEYLAPWESIRSAEVGRDTVTILRRLRCAR